MTNAERQARWRQRQTEAVKRLEAENARLRDEVVTLRKQLLKQQWKEVQNRSLFVTKAEMAP